MNVKSESEVTQLCPTLSYPMDCSPPGSFVHGIFQARVLEWVPLPSPSGLLLSNKRNVHTQHRWISTSLCWRKVPDPHSLHKDSMHDSTYIKFSKRQTNIQWQKTKQLSPVDGCGRKDGLHKSSKKLSRIWWESPVWGSSLAAQWLRFCTPNAGGWDQSVVRDLRPCMPCGKQTIKEKSSLWIVLMTSLYISIYISIHQKWYN